MSQFFNLSEIEKSEATCKSLATLSAYKKGLLKESQDKELLEAAKALEVARERYNKVSNKILLSDTLFNQLQTQLVTSTINALARLHKAKGFYDWYEGNQKYIQTKVIDTPARLLTHSNELYKAYRSGAKTAKAKLTDIDSLRKQISALQALLLQEHGGGGE